jgi:hypothetical protein
MNELSASTSPANQASASPGLEMLGTGGRLGGVTGAVSL